MKRFLILMVAGLFSMTAIGQTIMDSSKTIQKMLIGTWVDTKDTNNIEIFSSDSLQEFWYTSDSNIVAAIIKYFVVKDYFMHEKIDTTYGIIDEYYGKRDIYLLSSTQLKIDGYLPTVQGTPPVLLFRKESDSVRFKLKSHFR